MTCPYCGFDHDDLDPHGDGEAEPHRPPKYVEGVYKPHFVTPDADVAVYVYPLDYGREPHVADVDDTGCVRKHPTDDHDPGKPLTEGGTTIVAVVVDDTVHYFGGWEDRIDTDDVERVVDL